MEIITIQLTNEQMKSLLYITGGSSLVRVKDILPDYKQFLPAELIDLVRDCNKIQFVTA